MNKHSCIEDIVVDIAGEKSDDQQSGGDLRKDSRTIGIGDVGAKSSTTLAVSVGKSTKSQSGEQIRVDENSEDDNVKTGESTIQKKRPRVRLRDVEGALKNSLFQIPIITH
jgi:c-di-AMP phosphodiesterase-like protein